MPQTAIWTALLPGNPQAAEITPIGSLDADPGTTALTSDDENSKPFLAVIHNGI
ncbi:hypothetical protein AB0D59_19575 [Streptomyces sp. NPDC048417]|uniref:hypothetical protein n=1 Tax=Streptomyces sp. NPDC048417 TaxID=3155387 RepID=UPI00343197B3